MQWIKHFINFNMSYIEIIPAIDILGGKCVRLSQGDYARQTVYSGDPLEVARMFEDAGIRRLHLVDLDGALKTRLVIDFGGGLKSDADLRIAFECGAAMITGGSIAVREPETFLEWLKTYGSGKIILGADAWEGKIAVSGWTEASETDIIPFIRSYAGKGIRTVISTDIAKDGMLTGPSYELYSQILEEIPGLYLIASGGISSIGDVTKLAEKGVPGVITGKAIYEGKITLKELAGFNKDN